MRKKDYELIASVFYVQFHGFFNETANKAKTEAIVNMAECLAEVFAVDNPKFDKQRFLTACGVIADDELYQQCTVCDYELQGDEKLGNICSSCSAKIPQ